MSLAELLQALAPGVTLRSATRVALNRVCIDSRAATPGCLFVALSGERTDGHAFVRQAFDAGAAVALIQRRVPDVPIYEPAQLAAVAALSTPIALLVPDTLRALQTLASARRAQHPNLRVVGITGSVGKTTAKETVAGVLAQAHPTLKNQGNYNNEIGLPLTLLRLQPEHRYAVLEMGMYALGEIAALCEIATPQIGIVTNVEPVHLERLGTMGRIAQAKAELVDALPAGGLAILNGDDLRVLAMARGRQARTLTYGLSGENGVWADEIQSLGMQGTRFRAHVAPSSGLDQAGESRQLCVSLLGRHAVMPALSAIALALAEGLTWEQIEAGLSSLEYGVRLVPKAAQRGATILDDTYNSSPASAVAALQVLDEFSGRHIAILGDMLELGALEEEGHLEVGRRCVSVLDVLVTVGEKARLIAQGAQAAASHADRLSSSSIHPCADNAQAIAQVKEMLQQGDAILIKGSRGMAMESIVQALQVTHNGA